MADTFTLEELTASEKTFRAPVEEPVPPVAAEVETPPVEPVVEPETPPAEGDVVENADSTPPVADDAATPPKGGARERIEELVADKNALRKYIEYREALWNQPPPKAETPAPVTPTLEAAPTLESCQYDTDKWTQAMNAWTQKQIQDGIKQALSTEKQTATVETQKQQFEARMEAFTKATPDAKTVLGNPALPQLSKEAAALLVASDIGPQVLYYLGKNPDKAARIARQTPIQQAEAIGRISAEIKVQPKPQKQLSNAPPPPTPNKGAVTPQEGGSIADFVARERKAAAERRRRH